MSTETITRGTDLGTLVTTLKDRRERYHDLIAPAAALRAQDGLLTIEDGLAALDPRDTSGVGTRAVRLAPTAAADGQIGDRLGVPGAYLRRCRAEPGLYDHNVNTWLSRLAQDENKRFLVRGLLRAPAGQQALTPGAAPGAGDHLGTAPSTHDPGRGGSGDGGSWGAGDGQVRGFLSDSFRMIDDYDVLCATVEGITAAGARDDVRVESCDLSERRMYVTFTSTAVRAMAPALLANYVSPFTGNRGADNPLVFAGFVLKNSELGWGAVSVTPRIEIQVCTNGMTLVKDAVGQIHQGGPRLQTGPVRWSEKTARLNRELIASKAGDAVTKFLDPGYLQQWVRRIEQEAGVAVADPVATVEHVRSQLSYSKAQGDAILADFIAGADPTSGGIGQAVTSVAQRQAEADTAHAMESHGLHAMSLAARYVMRS